MTLYDVALVLPMESEVPHYLTQAIAVIGMRPVMAVDVILGRDVLRHCTLIYEGKSSQCRLVI